MCVYRGLVVSVFAFYSYDPSSNTSQVNSLSVKMVDRQTKRGPILMNAPLMLNDNMLGHKKVFNKMLYVWQRMATK